MESPTVSPLRARVKIDMTIYRHIHPTLSSAQQDNYVRLARYLVIASQGDAWNPANFDMRQTPIDLMTGDELQPDQMAAHCGPLLGGPLGYGPLAGIAALPGEDWPAYQVRVLGVAPDSPLEDWLLSALWRGADSTAVGAAMRLMYVLDYGVPEDWMEIVQGRRDSDYRDNGFLWDRVGLAPPEKR